MAALAFDSSVHRGSNKALKRDKTTTRRFDATLFMRPPTEKSCTASKQKSKLPKVPEDEKPHEDGVYTYEYYMDLLARESRYHVYQPESSYLRYRKLLVEFLYEIGRYCRLSSLSVPLAVQYLDRILAKSNVAEKYLYLVTSCCSLIAAKFSDTEDRLPKISDLDEWCAGEYTCDMIRKHEGIFVAMLGWQLHSVTPMHFALYYLGSEEFVESLKSDGCPTLTITAPSSKSDKSNGSSRRKSVKKDSKGDKSEAKVGIFNPASLDENTTTLRETSKGGPLSSIMSSSAAAASGDDLMDEKSLKRVQKEMRSLCHWFAEAYIHDYDFQQYMPSIVASAIVASSRRVLGFARVWPLSLETLTTHRFYDISLCEAKMYRLYHKKKQAAAAKANKKGEKEKSTSSMTGKSKQYAPVVA